MTPGTFMGQSRTATPCDCNELLKPFGVAAPACCYQQVDRINPDYVPDAGNAYAIPVQFGSVWNLCPAFTCEPGRDFALLGWVDRTANEYRIARVNPTADMFEDDSVSVGDMRVVWSSGSRTIHTGCIAVIDEQLFAFISSRLTTNGLIECYIANDVENPTSWTLRGTIQTHTSPSPPGTLSVRNAGPPTVTPTGRWLLPMHSWTTFAASALEDAIGLFVSDDQGVTWTMKVSFRKGALFGGTAGSQSTCITWDPISNQYVFGAHVGSSTQWVVYTSSDNGTTWTSSADIVGSIDPIFYASTGLALYAARHISTDLYLYRVGDPTVFASWTDLGLIGIDGGSSDQDDGIQIIPMISSCGHEGMVFTMKDRITRDEAASVPVYGRPSGGGGSGGPGGGVGPTPTPPGGGGPEPPIPPVTPPDPPPEPDPDPEDPGFTIGVTKPTAGNTGIRESTTSTISGSGSPRTLTVTTNGVTYNRVRFECNVNVKATGTTFNDCVFVGPSSPIATTVAIVRTQDGYNTTFNFCSWSERLFYLPTTPGTLGASVFVGNSTLYRCDITGSQDGIGIVGPNVNVLGCRIHDMWYFSPDMNAVDHFTHVDCIQLHKISGNVLIQGNTLESIGDPDLPLCTIDVPGPALSGGNPNYLDYPDWQGYTFPPWGTSCVMMSPYQPGMSNIVLDRNWMKGGSVCININPNYTNATASGFAVTNNRWGRVQRGNANGNVLSAKSTLPITMTGNVFEDDLSPYNVRING